MTTFKFQCKHCQKELQANASIIGEKLDCIFCQKKIIVPNPLKEDNNKEDKSIREKANVFIFELTCFLGVIFSISYFFRGISQAAATDSILGSILAVLSAILFFLIFTVNKIVHILSK